MALHRIHIILLVFFAFGQLKAQKTATIQGSAPFYKGKELICTSYKDYMSFELDELGKTSIDKEGHFTLTIPMNETRQISLHCGGAQAMMYADPSAVYDVVLNRADSSQANAYRQNVRIDFDSLPTYDINNLILDFNSRQDDFLFYNFSLFGKPQFEDRLDTFKIYLSKVYKNVSHEYFTDFVAYSIAETEMLGMPRRDEGAFTRLIFGTYVFKKPVRYNNDKYMNFFTKFYGDVFKMIPVTDEMDLFRAINKYASPELAKRVLKKDVMLREDKICELALLRSLGQEYYNKEFDTEMILKTLDSIGNHSKYEQHKSIAINIKKRLMYLAAGSLAPEFSLLDVRDSLVSMNKFNGKFIYLMFWSVDNITSINEMKMMKGLYEKYKWDFEFISINVDDDINLMKNFVRKNKYAWTFVHHGKDTRIRDKYNASTLPQYYLIGPDRVLLQAPALHPAANATYKSIEETFYKIHKKLHPEKKHIPGQKEN